DLIIILLFFRHIYFTKVKTSVSVRHFLIYLLVGMIVLPLHPLIVYSEAGDEELKGPEHIEKYSLLGYQLLDVYTVIKDSNETLDEHEIAMLESFFQGKKQTIQVSTGVDSEQIGRASCRERSNVSDIQ